MASKTDICNLALSAIGSKRVTAVPGEHERGRLCDLYYDVVRREVLHAHPWGRANKRATIAKDAIDPTSGYDHRYLLPADHIRIIAINKRTTRNWEIEDNYIVTHDDSPIDVKYTHDLQDTTKFSPTLVQAISTRLALYLGERLADTSASKKEELRVTYEQLLRDAKRFDGRERSSHRLADTSWLTARGS